MPRKGANQERISGTIQIQPISRLRRLLEACGDIPSNPESCRPHAIPQNPQLRAHAFPGGILCSVGLGTLSYGHMIFSRINV
jgi:hypothetical protein